ncbi:MAG: alpha/beta hydrolase [Bacteroidia bacterium]|jgi:proline iminopeptidase|nr:alpha/beta hydrolase [Bacteroidia bacterium]
MNLNKLLLLVTVASSLLVACTKELELKDPGNLVPQTVDQDASLPSIIVNGVQLHAEAYGHPDSTLVVCIHGGPGADYRYLLNAKSLADYGYRVVFYDQIGSGLSKRYPASRYTDDPQAAVDYFYHELRGVIAHYRTHPGQKVYLLGHSWGGMLGAAYSGRYPNEIQGLVVCEPGGLKWDDVVEYGRNMASFNVLNENPNNSLYIDQLLSDEEDEHVVLDYKWALQGSYAQPATGDDLRVPFSFWRGGAVLNDVIFKIGNDVKPDFSAGLNNFQVPVLFFYSTENKAYPTSWAEKISSSFNTVEVVKAAGSHSSMILETDIWNNFIQPKIITYFNSL